MTELSWNIASHSLYTALWTAHVVIQNLLCLKLGIPSRNAAFARVLILQASTGNLRGRLRVGGCDRFAYILRQAWTGQVAGYCECSYLVASGTVHVCIVPPVKMSTPRDSGFQIHHMQSLVASISVTLRIQSSGRIVGTYRLGEDKQLAVLGRAYELFSWIRLAMGERQDGMRSFPALINFLILILELDPENPSRSHPDPCLALHA